MSKKSPLLFIEEYSENTKKAYRQSIRKFEKFHDCSMEELIEEALNEQRENISEDMLSIYDRLLDFRRHLCNEYTYNTVVSYFVKIEKIYKMNRVRIPYIPPLNQKRIKRNPELEYEDILTKDELRKILPEFNNEGRIRAMAMMSGGFATQEAENLTKKQFYDDLKKEGESYHECMERLSKTDNCIWVTKLRRQKTGKAYYGLVSPETVQEIAKVRRYDISCDGKLFEISQDYFSKKCRKINEKLNLGTAGGFSKLTTHSFRRFHATHIKASILSYEESLKVNEIDELQGRGLTKTQDSYMKTNKTKQKLLYAKILNNISLYNEYEYEIVDDDVVVHRINKEKKYKEIKKENEILKKQKNRKTISPEMEKFIREVGIDNFIEEVKELSSN